MHFPITPATQRLLLGCACRRQTKLLAHGTQARSGVGAATPTLLATLLPSVFQKLTCNQLAPASAYLQRGQRSITWVLPGCMQHRYLHPPSHTANGQHLSGDCSNQHITFTRHSASAYAYACHQPHPRAAPASSLSTLPSEPASKHPGGPLSNMGAWAATVDARHPPKFGFLVGPLDTATGDGAQRHGYPMNAECTNDPVSSAAISSARD